MGKVEFEFAKNLCAFAASFYIVPLIQNCTSHSFLGNHVTVSRSYGNNSNHITIKMTSEKYSEKGIYLVVYLCVMWNKPQI